MKPFLLAAAWLLPALILGGQTLPEAPPQPAPFPPTPSQGVPFPEALPEPPLSSLPLPAETRGNPPAPGSFLAPPGPSWDQAVSALGWTLEEAYRNLGVPSRVYPLRGGEDWQDDVVFYYGSWGISLFWFRDRVWAVRFDSGFRGMIGLLSLGLNREQAALSLGSPPQAGEADWEVFFLGGYDFPVRLQIYYQDEKAWDLYLYRGDY